MRDWDTLYKTEKDPFGEEPSKLVKNYSHLFPKNEPVLDLGCGSGRNSLYLAKQGFKVTCVDVSIEAIKTLVIKASELGVSSNINAITSDISKTENWDGKYGAIICYTTLHFIKDIDARTVISAMRVQTIEKGLNIIADFAGDGPLKRDSDKFWLKNDELKSLYSDWTELLYKEESVRTKAKDESGNTYMQNMAILVTQK